MLFQWVGVIAVLSALWSSFAEETGSTSSLEGVTRTISQRKSDAFQNHDLLWAEQSPTFADGFEFFGNGVSPTREKSSSVASFQGSQADGIWTLSLLNLVDEQAAVKQTKSSVTPTPEPGTVALAVGGVALMLLKKKKLKRFNSGVG